MGLPYTLCIVMSSDSRGVRLTRSAEQRTLTYFIRGSITARLTSCLTGLALTKLVHVYLIQHKQSSWILISQTGGQLFRDTSPYKVSECSLGRDRKFRFFALHPSAAPVKRTSCEWALGYLCLFLVFSDALLSLNFLEFLLFRARSEINKKQTNI